MEKREQLYEGKAKKVYKTDDPELLIVSYKDDATAFNGEKKGTIVGKGVINNKMSNMMFKIMESKGIPTHLVEELSDRETAVKKVEIVPLEVIIRNTAASFEGTCQQKHIAIELVLTGENIGFIIGHRGETLDSLQYLASLVANHVDESYYRITLDVGNYREKRKETLENLGRKMAARAVKTGRNASLEPMNPYERRIIHTAVQEVEGAKSWSEGEDLARHVVIGPEGGERYVRRDNRRGGNNRGRNGGYNRDNRGGRAPRRDNRDSRPAQNRTAPAAPRVLDDVSTPYGKISKN